MPLFHPRLVKARLQVTAIPVPHLKILQAWRDSIESCSIFKQNETSFDAYFIQKILIEVLGYCQDLDGTRTLWKNKPIGSGNVDVALGDFSAGHDQILAPLELKGAKTKDLDAIMPGRHKTPVQQAWEYANDAPGAQWVLVSNYLEIRLYAVGHGRQHYEAWDLAKLTEPLEYARLQWLISAKQLLSGETRRLLEQSSQLEQQITNQLYRDYKTLRDNLLCVLPTANPNVPPLELIRHSHTILDRILFIAFAEDRGLLPNKTIAQACQHNPYAPQPIWENFKGLFRAIDGGNAALKIPAYNGGLFAIDPDLASLVVDDSLCQGFKQLADYDFASEVSVTVLGHIFEQSISDIEGLQAAARGEAVSSGVSKRKQYGVVYTPDYITNFIVEQTLGGHLRTQFAHIWEATATQRHGTGTWKKQEFEIQFWRNYQYILRAIRVLDPACGSGAFLVAAFELLHEEYSRVNNILADLSGGTMGVFDLDKEILTRNLYGVDLNAESIEITKLLLWLKTAKHGKVLNDLDATIRVGNSLIEDPAYTDKPFVWTQFAAEARGLNTADLFFYDAKKPSGTLGFGSDPTIGGTRGFDVILGNPPYVRQELLSPIKPYLQQHYKVYNGVVDLYAYFFELGLNLLKPGGRLGYISSSTFFKTGSGENLRRLLLATTSLETIVDFGDLQIFAGVTTYPAIVTLRKAAPAPDHKVQMLVLGTTIPVDLAKHFTAQSSLISQASLDMAAWRLENSALIALRHKLTAGKPTLKAVYGSPYRGILTGLNAAFVVDQATRDALVRADPKFAEDIEAIFGRQGFEKMARRRTRFGIDFFTERLDAATYYGK